MPFLIGVENVTRAVWFDDVFFREKTENGLGDNLIKNPGFDTGGTKAGAPKAKENIYRKAYNEGLTSKTMTMDEFNKVSGILNEIQLEKAKDTPSFSMRS